LGGGGGGAGIHQGVSHPGRVGDTETRVRFFFFLEITDSVTFQAVIHHGVEFPPDLSTGWWYSSKAQSIIPGARSRSRRSGKASRQLNLALFFLFLFSPRVRCENQ
jgi:hypothetical protein